jgi:hypothetical protein
MTGVSPVGGAATAGFGYTPYTPPSPGRAAKGRGEGGGEEGADERRRPPDWQQVLTELEGEVTAAEETLARGRAEEIAAWGQRAEDWVPPSQLGAIPVDLRERALRLLQHQLAVAEALIERITQSQRQRDVAARMSYGPDRPVASYIDRAV